MVPNPAAHIVDKFTSTRESTGTYTFKDCHPVTFSQFIDVAQFTNPRCDQARYKLTGLISHKGNNPAEGHYISFSYINDSWYLFDDSNVRKVNESAVFDENYPKDASCQTAVLLVYQQSL
jgi:ubiquitin C-terminal hydrolase